MITNQEKMYNFRRGYLEKFMGKEPRGGFSATLSVNDFNKILNEERIRIENIFENGVVKQYFMGFELIKSPYVEDGHPMLGFTETQK